MDYLQAAKDAKCTPVELEDSGIEIYSKDAYIFAFIAIAEQVTRLADAAERIAAALEQKSVKAGGWRLLGPYIQPGAQTLFANEWEAQDAANRLNEKHRNSNSPLHWIEPSFSN